MSEIRLIDANALKPKIDKFIGYLDEDMIERIKVVIDNATTVDVPNYGGQVVPDTLQGWRYEERPQGEWARHDEWVDGEYVGGFYHVNCPVDDGYFVKWRMNYCGNCGARMKGGAV